MNCRRERKWKENINSIHICDSTLAERQRGQITYHNESTAQNSFQIKRYFMHVKWGQNQKGFMKASHFVMGFSWFFSFQRDEASQNRRGLLAPSFPSPSRSSYSSKYVSFYSSSCFYTFMTWMYVHKKYEILLSIFKLFMRKLQASYCNISFFIQYYVFGIDPFS